MTTSPRPAGRSFLRAVAIVFVFTLAFPAGSVPSASAQSSSSDSFIQPIPGTGPTVGPGIGQPLSPSPGSVIQGVPPGDPRHNDPSLPGYLEPGERLGNCCLMYIDEDHPGSYISGGGIVPDRVECASGVGVGLFTPADQIQACKDFSPDYVDDYTPYTYGIHYNFTSWEECNIQCGDELDVGYCDTENYVCIAPENIDPITQDYNKLRIYKDMATCNERCVMPEEVEVSLGCACDKDTATNTCTVTAWEDKYSLDPADYNAITIQNVFVQMRWNKAFGDTPNPGMSPEDGLVYDENGADTLLVPAQPNADGVDNAEYTSITYPGPIEIPAGGMFRATFTVPAVEDDSVINVSDEATITASVPPTVSETDITNNVATAEVAPLGSCGSFAVNAECRENEPGVPRLTNTYTLALPAAGGASRIEATFTLDPNLCLDEQNVTIYDLNCTQPDSVNREFTCTWEADTATYPGSGFPPSLSFDALVHPDYGTDANPDDECAPESVIDVTASVTVGSGSPQEYSVPLSDMYKKPCGLCDICGSVLASNYESSEDAQAACEGLKPVGASESYCSWGFDFRTKSINCHANEENDVCPIGYACCVESGDDEDAPAYTYLYGFRNTIGDYYPGEQEYFDAKACYDDAEAGVLTEDSDVFYVNKWSERPDLNYYDGGDYSEYDWNLDRCEEEDETGGSESSASRPTQPGTNDDLDYFCENTYNETEYTRQVGNLDMITNPLEPIDCKVYDAEPLDNPPITIYFSYAYTPTGNPDTEDLVAEFTPRIDNFNLMNGLTLDATAEYDKISCTDTCERTKKFVTCGAVDGCQDNVLWTSCLGGQMYPVGPVSSAECDRDYADGLFAFPTENRPFGMIFDPS